MSRAIRSAYGTGWNESVEGIDLNRTRPKGKPPEIDALLTARVGMVLQLAGERPGGEKFAAAAVEAGRGLLAIQARTGQIRPVGVMGVFGAVTEELDVPDRRPTTAALATLLAILGPQQKQDGRLRGPSLKAAHWLVGQQTRAGGWPNLYPPQATRGQGVKLLVFDDNDYRDTALTVLLAAEILGPQDADGVRRPERQLQVAFTRGVEMALFCRVNAGFPPSRALWPSMARPDGDLQTKQDVPSRVDLLATRYALELVLAGYLVQQEASFGDGLRGARDAISTLPRDPQKQWHRLYDLQLKAIPAPPPDAGGTFRLPGPAPRAGASPRTADLFNALERAVELGAKRSYDAWQAALPMDRRLGWLVSGLADDAILAERPTMTPAEGLPPGAVMDTVIDAWKGLHGQPSGGNGS